MVQFNVMSVVFQTLTTAVYISNGFNLSPQPNIIFREPNLTTFIPKFESSYFGYTIVLRESSIVIGAPRAQSTLESQQNINETGAIYKCSFARGDCAPYIFDPDGNIMEQHNEFATKKAKQWLGASMDGGPKDTDKLVVCAPRLTVDSGDVNFLIGVCYWTPDTLTDRPTVKTIDPFQSQVQNIYYNAGMELGISVHVTDDHQEILMGAPNYGIWSGCIIRYRRQSNRSIEYKADISTSFFGREFMYSGYSVSSGTFDSANPFKIYYIVSAPRFSSQDLIGKVFIFDMVETSQGTLIKSRICYTFNGSQLVEYFGYAVLAEDINGDGLADLIITAPQYSSGESAAEGAFYVYINKGEFAFELQKTIVSLIDGHGGFGATVTKLDDINHDGYNDIAIGAPFAENGAVFIYLGGASGLPEQFSQKLTSASTVNSWGPHMFGYGLSKGADIDNNGFNDLAIGAPNAEVVFVYRAYPVVKINATIHSLSRLIKPEENNIQFNVCYMISTTSQKVQSQELTMKINLDPQVKRFTLKQTHSGELTFNATAATQNECRVFDAMVTFSPADIYRPIELELHYDLTNPVPNSEVFCDECAAVDPADSKVYVEQITFSTGCEADICVADLSLTSSGLQPTYVLGSSSTMSVTYEVSNSGETAYLPQINVTSSNQMPFAKIPSSCKLHRHVLLCDLYQGQLMDNGTKTSLTIVYDVSTIEGKKSMTLTAAVFSNGKELNPSNNVVNDVIALTEFTEIEAIGQPQTPHIKLDKTSQTVQIVNTYEVKSNGPSRVKELEIFFELPIEYKFDDSSETLPIVYLNNVTLQGVYDQQILPVELYQNNTLPLVNPTEISMASTEIMNEELKSVNVDSMFGKFNDKPSDVAMELWSIGKTNAQHRPLGQDITMGSWLKVVMHFVYIDSVIN